MRVIQIKARNFRNYAHLEVWPDRFFNVIRGQNAQGKTNFIEAIFFVLRGFSFRTTREKEVLSWGSDSATVEATVEQVDYNIEVRVEFSPAGKKIFWNGQPVGRTVLGGRMGVVLFTPDDLQLLKGGPRDRRRFLDLELGFLLPRYLEDLRCYRRALEQRNSLLRAGGRGREGETLDLWTDRLCHYGAAVLSGRLQMLQQLAPLACRFFNTWGGGELAVRYRSSVSLGNGALVAENLREALAALRQEEWRYGQTRAGPHLDDLAFIVDGRDARSFASQGQQRGIVLALKLAAVMLWKQATGGFPVVLLDDVLFEFDRERRQRVLTTLQDTAQVFLTTGDQRWPANRVFYVHSGNIGEGRGEKCSCTSEQT